MFFGIGLGLILLSFGLCKVVEFRIVTNSIDNLIEVLFYSGIALMGGSTIYLVWNILP